MVIGEYLPREIRPMRIAILFVLGIATTSHPVATAADRGNLDTEAVQQALQNPSVDNLPLLLTAAQQAKNCFPKQSAASVAVTRLGQQAVPTIVARVKQQRSKAWTQQVDNLYLLAQLGPEAKAAAPVLKEIVAAPKTQRYVRHFAATALAAIDGDSKSLVQLATSTVDFGDVAVLTLEKMVSDGRAQTQILEQARKQKQQYATMRKAYQAKWKSLGAIHPVNAARDDELVTLALGNDLNVLPKEVTELKNLTSLELQGNQLTELPSAIGKLDRLTYLDLSENPITNGELGKLKSLQNLQFLVLIETKATQEGVAELRSAMPNCSIKCDFDRQ